MADDFAGIEIVKGEPVLDRKSQFLGHAARVTSEAEVAHVLATLKSNSKIMRATHNIYAYRLTDNGRGMPLHNHDDDGETAAGIRLAALLDASKVENVIVVVSRWFGGTLIGPDRYKHINSCARSALGSLGGDAAEAAPAASGKAAKGGKAGKNAKGAKAAKGAAAPAAAPVAETGRQKKGKKGGK